MDLWSPSSVFSFIEDFISEYMIMVKKFCSTKVIYSSYRFIISAENGLGSIISHNSRTIGISRRYSKKKVVYASL